MHAILVAGVVSSSLTSVIKGGLLLALFLSLLRNVRLMRHVLPLDITCRADGSILLVRQNGQTSEWRLSGDSIVLPQLIVLSLTTGQRHLRVLIMPTDTVTAANHRRLRRWLRWHASVAGDLASI